MQVADEDASVAWELLRVVSGPRCELVERDVWGFISNGAEFHTGAWNHRLRPIAEVRVGPAGRLKTAGGSWIRQRGGLRLRLLDRPAASSKPASTAARFWRIRGLHPARVRHPHPRDRDTRGEFGRRARDRSQGAAIDALGPREWVRAGLGHGRAAKELVDQRAAALGVVEEGGVAPWDDLEARVG